MNHQELANMDVRSRLAQQSTNNHDREIRELRIRIEKIEKFLNKHVCGPNEHLGE
jgi:hypothetical protein